VNTDFDDDDDGDKWILIDLIRSRKCVLGADSDDNGCVCSPTPRVTWRRADQQLVEDGGRVYSDSFGQELVIRDVDFADEGIYECTAVNTESGQPNATRRTQLVVQCKLGIHDHVLIIAL